MLSVVIPCLNEAENLPTLLKRLNYISESKNLELEIVVVDDCSTDDTNEILEKAKVTYSNISLSVIRNAKNIGIYKSWRVGVASAKNDLILLMDGDLQNQPEDLALMLEVYRSKSCHAVQGVRVNIDNEDPIRTFLSRNFAVLLRFFTRINLQDPKSGFILSEKVALQASLDKIVGFRHPQSFIALGLAWDGYVVEEILTRFDKRTAGTSFLKSKLTRTVIESLFDLVKAREFNKFLQVGNDQLSTWNLKQRLKLKLYFWTMPFHAWNIRRSTIFKLYHLLETEKFTESEWNVYQDKKLTKMLNHSQKNIHWLKKSNTVNGPKSNYAKLSGFPLLEKTDLKELGPVPFMDFSNKYKTHRIATSGSTGSPLIVFADREQLEWRFASTLRALMWTGWKIGDKQYRLWHQKIGMTRVEVIKERIDAAFLRRKFIPAFEFDDKKVHKLLMEISMTKPFLVDGYAESLDYLTKASHQLKDLEIPAIMSSAQTLTTQTRNILERTFKAKVYDKYGSREFSGIAYQCGYGPWFHIMADSYIVEILVDGQTPANPGQVGEVVVTDLNNKLFPLIRYRIGDLATAVDNAENCKCGRNMPRIGNIVGRTAALIVTPGKRVLPGTFFAHFFKDYELIVFQYQIVQDTKDAITLKFVKGRSYSDSGFEKLLISLSEFLDGMTLNIEAVDVIPMGRTGKRSPVVSLISIE